MTMAQSTGAREAPSPPDSIASGSGGSSVGAPLSPQSGSQISAQSHMVVDFSQPGPNFESTRGWWSNNLTWKDTLRCLYNHEKNHEEETNNLILHKDVGFMLRDESTGNYSPVFAHAFVLQCRSGYFSSILRKLFLHALMGNGESQEEAEQKLWEMQPIRITPDLADLATFKRMIKFMYLEEVDEDLGFEDLMKLMQVGKLFDVKALEMQCKAMLMTKDKIDANTVLAMYTFAEKSEDAALMEKCLGIMLKNGESVLQKPEFTSVSHDLLCKLVKSDDLNASESLIFRSCIAWAREELKRKGEEESGESLRNVLGPVHSSYIRYPLMDKDFVLYEVKPLGVVKESLMLELTLYFLTQNSQMLKSNPDPLKGRATQQQCLEPRQKPPPVSIIKSSPRAITTEPREIPLELIEIDPPNAAHAPSSSASGSNIVPSNPAMPPTATANGLNAVPRPSSSAGSNGRHGNGSNSSTGNRPVAPPSPKIGNMLNTSTVPRPSSSIESKGDTLRLPTINSRRPPAPPPPLIGKLSGAAAPATARPSSSSNGGLAVGELFRSRNPLAATTAAAPSVYKPNVTVSRTSDDTTSVGQPVSSKSEPKPVPATATYVEDPRLVRRRQRLAEAIAAGKISKNPPSQSMSPPRSPSPTVNTTTSSGGNENKDKSIAPADNLPAKEDIQAERKRKLSENESHPVIDAKRSTLQTKIPPSQEVPDTDLVICSMLNSELSKEDIRWRLTVALQLQKLTGLHQITKIRLNNVLLKKRRNSIADIRTPNLKELEIVLNTSDPPNQTLPEYDPDDYLIFKTTLGNSTDVDFNEEMWKDPTKMCIWENKIRRFELDPTEGGLIVNFEDEGISTRLLQQLGTAPEMKKLGVLAPVFPSAINLENLTHLILHRCEIKNTEFLLECRSLQKLSWVGFFAKDTLEVSHLVNCSDTLANLALCNLRINLAAKTVFPSLMSINLELCHWRENFEAEFGYLFPFAKRLFITAFHNFMPSDILTEQLLVKMKLMEKVFIVYITNHIACDQRTRGAVRFLKFLGKNVKIANSNIERVNIPATGFFLRRNATTSMWSLLMNENINRNKEFFDFFMIFRFSQSMEAFMKNVVYSCKHPNCCGRYFRDANIVGLCLHEQDLEGYSVCCPNSSKPFALPNLNPVISSEKSPPGVSPVPGTSPMFMFGTSPSPGHVASHISPLLGTPPTPMTSPVSPLFGTSLYGSPIISPSAGPGLLPTNNNFSIEQHASMWMPSAIAAYKPLPKPPAPRIKKLN